MTPPELADMRKVLAAERERSGRLVEALRWIRDESAGSCVSDVATYAECAAHSDGACSFHIASDALSDAPPACVHGTPIEGACFDCAQDHERPPARAPPAAPAVTPDREAEVRREALEEAAGVCDARALALKNLDAANASEDCANAIRALVGRE